MNFSRFLAMTCVMAVLALVSAPAFAQLSVSVDVAPPPLVVEDQPACTDDGYIWTPGYWGYDDASGEYYWVDGAWVQPPQPDLYWTPAYWGWSGNVYAFYPGYWGPNVGFYGGINYGYGYGGHGYNGGRWDHGHFSYNSAANNLGSGRVHNTYADRSAVRKPSGHVSYNGGKGGITAQPTAQEQVAQGNHVQPTPQQQSHFNAAAQQRTHQVKVNHSAGGPVGGQPGADRAATGEPQVNHPGGNQPPVNRPAVTPAGSQPFTGNEPQTAPRETPNTQQRVAPENPVHQAPPVNEVRPQGQAPMTGEHPQAVPNERPSVEPQGRPSGAPAEVPHTAGPGAVPHGPSAPAVHPQAPAAAPHPAPAAAPASAPQGGNGGGGNDHH